MLAAQFKAGKTTLGGEPGPGARRRQSVSRQIRRRACRGQSALLDFEMGTGQLKRWYRDQQIRRTDEVVVIPMRGHAASFNLADAESARSGSSASANSASATSSSTACARFSMRSGSTSTRTSARISCRSTRCSPRRASRRARGASHGPHERTVARR